MKQISLLLLLVLVFIAGCKTPTDPLLLDTQYHTAIDHLMTTHTNPPGHTTTKQEIAERRAVHEDLKRLADHNPPKTLQQLLLYVEQHQQDRKRANMVGELIPWFGFSVGEVRTAVKPFINSDNGFLKKIGKELQDGVKSGEMQKQQEYITEILNQEQEESIGIGTPLAGRPSHTTNRTDRVISGSAYAKGLRRDTSAVY